VKLTGKWTPEERKAVANVLCFFIFESARNIGSAHELLGGVMRVTQVLNYDAKNLGFLLAPMQELIDSIGPSAASILAEGPPDPKPDNTN
jgi:hypothetical protein